MSGSQTTRATQVLEPLAFSETHAGTDRGCDGVHGDWGAALRRGPKLPLRLDRREDP